MGKNKYEDLYENIINGTYNYEEEQQKGEQNRNMFYLIRELNANPDMLENVKKMMDYRDLRTKQSWLSNFYYNSNKFNDGELKLQTLKMRCIGLIEIEENIIIMLLHLSIL